ncbi:MAG TPA: ammonia channel protein, partial [Burkholderiaceae bacterium]|nr:ammonia channel protein [Burkholderiaceae bacterium]
MKKHIAYLVTAGALLFGLGLSASSMADDAPAKASATASAPAASTPVAAPAAAPVAAATPAAAEAAPAVAAPAAPVPNKGDTAWMLIATALVILMTIPGLALFYGGLVRSKNMLSILIQVFMIFALIIVLWCIYGYSFAFTEHNAFIGGTDRLFLKGIWDPVKATFAT